jgi:hypothetical protein
MMLPQFTTLKKWADSLIIDFPTDNIPILLDETKWKEWGNMLVQENSFSRNAAPGPQGYAAWPEWAMAVFYTMAQVSTPKTPDSSGIVNN